MKKIKKSQIKFGETIGIIIIVYFILMAGLIFYNNYNNKALKELRDKQAIDFSYNSYQYLNNLNLIHSSVSGVISVDYSYYGLKTLSNFSKTKEGNDYLFQTLKFSTIKIYLYKLNKSSLLYNFNKSFENFTIYNRTPPNGKNILFVNKFRTLITIDDQVNKEKYLGKMELTNYITS
jgi:hypothetical protein